MSDDYSDVLDELMQADEICLGCDRPISCCECIVEVAEGPPRQPPQLSESHIKHLAALQKVREFYRQEVRSRFQIGDTGKFLDGGTDAFRWAGESFIYDGIKDTSAYFVVASNPVTKKGRKKTHYCSCKLFLQAVLGVDVVRELLKKAGC